ncbi:hypothetical protein NKR23_g11307 [Pleurostoma richardsiae]|uniref:Uncharacterized protein n=1 Tax=Pleurostoma richardsiae TaxID=41990 RepID=A0AA38R3R9_9PEZI|nr:hypothetical protein NKR23_g11307 [Pleurostoma richardsiae]
MGTTQVLSDELPTRILVQTKTHLVPGDKYEERCQRMKNLICQFHWKRDFDPNQDRWHAQAAFGLDDKSCYFLLDHGQSGGDVPILWYKWTGMSFKPVQASLPPQLQAKLKGYPFMPQKNQRKPQNKPLDAETRRQMIRTRLRCNMTIPQADVEFLRDPNEAKWLKDNIDPRLWSRCEALSEAR